MFPLNLENQRKAVCFTLLMDFTVLLSLFLYPRSSCKCTVPLISDHVCSIRVLVCVLRNVVLRVRSSNRDGENDMNSSMSNHKFNYFFKSLLLHGKRCVPFICVCLSSEWPSEAIYYKHFNLYLAENKTLHTIWI